MNLLKNVDVIVFSKGLALLFFLALLFSVVANAMPEPTGPSVRVLNCTHAKGHVTIIKVDEDDDQTILEDVNCPYVNVLPKETCTKKSCDLPPKKDPRP